MSLNLVPAGKDLPEDIYVVIEIPANADPIKYEIDKETGALFVDRFMSTAMFYPCNYGYINHTLSLDGDPVDVLVPTPYPLQPGSVIRCRPVGVLKMTDEAGEDAKLVAVPHSKLTKEYDHVKDVNDLPELLKAQIAHFFEHYKDLEKGKWVKVEGWADAAAAKAEIIASFERAARSNASRRPMKKHRSLSGVFFLLLVETLQPVAAGNPRVTVHAVFVQVDPRTPIRRLNQLALIVLGVAFQFVQLCQNR